MHYLKVFENVGSHTSWRDVPIMSIYRLPLVNLPQDVVSFACQQIWTYNPTVTFMYVDLLYNKLSRIYSSKHPSLGHLKIYMEPTCPHRSFLMLHSKELSKRQSIQDLQSGGSSHVGPRSEELIWPSPPLELNASTKWPSETISPTYSTVGTLGSRSSSQ